ncbi:DUF2249 domain-containing protein, partial [Micromonospora sp. NPDC049799]|uniref:DUF2249 domain-containing protein n=1 Tax=Micromonospora sp. NPDC049799 TaxID=3154741 RepID=UPI0033F9434F
PRWRAWPGGGPRRRRGTPASAALVAPHAPRPLLAEVEARYGDGMTTEWLQDGPEVWQVRLSRQPVAA